jgi:hypothetical protein
MNIDGITKFDDFICKKKKKIELNIIFYFEFS